MRKTVSLPKQTYDRLEQLQQHVESVTGMRPSFTALIDRCITDGAEAMRRRPALAIDATPRKGDV